MRFVVFLLALLCPIVFAQSITTAPTPAAVTPINLMPPGKVYVKPSLFQNPRAGYSDRRIYFAGCNTGSPGAMSNDNGGPGAGFFPGCNATNAPVRDPSGAGAFRIFCTFVKLGFDDPIVWPGQAGRTHGHAFYGNTTTNFQTDINRMDEIGNSSCGGGIVNRTGYWAPFIVVECPVDVLGICTTAADHGRPIIAPVANFYYKSSDINNPTTGWPTKGLRMIAGDPNWTGTDGGGYFGPGAPRDANGVYPVYWECWNNQSGNPVTPMDANGFGFGGNSHIGTGPNGVGALPYRFDHIPTSAEAAALTASVNTASSPGFDPARTICNVIKMNVQFPQCMKAIDMLDSPDHKAHVAYPNFSLGAGLACPNGFTARLIPSIEGLFLFTVDPSLLDYVRLSSDYSKAGAIAAGLPCATSAKNFCAGVTGHMDWVNGWDQTTLYNGHAIPEWILINCHPEPYAAPYNTAGKNCSDQVIGDIFRDGKNYKLAF